MAGALRFADIEKEFLDRVGRIVWCTVSTTDTKGRPYSRILHPVWEGATGWIATGRQTLKTKHLAENPNVSLAYWDPQHDTAVVQARAEWCDDMATQDADLEPAEEHAAAGRLRPAALLAQRHGRLVRRA